ncbi:MAG TPA: hypothetical protein VLH79_09770 [Chthonomonadales bacterium]|nr:hypothetical protein [Chthonomonadales bacterium]
MYWRLAGTLLLALAVFMVIVTLVPTWNEPEPGTPPGVCLQGCERTYYAALSKCRDRYRDCYQSWLGRRSSFYRYHVCVPKQTFCAGHAYRVFLWCQLGCPMDDLL